MMGTTGAHIAGIPVEETLATYGPVLVLALSAGAATVAIRLRRLRERRAARLQPQRHAGGRPPST
jgi:hypothetical protein